MNESGRIAGDPRGKIPFYRALLGSVLLLLLALGTLSYLWILHNLFPGVAVVRVPTAEEAPGAPARAGPRRRIRIIQPASNVACAEKQGFDLWAQVVHWRGLAEASGLAAELGGVERIPPHPGSVDALVIPWLLCLDDAARAAVDRYARAGGGVILAGGSDLAGEVPERLEAEAHFVVPAGRTAPGSGLAPGRRLELPIDSPALASTAGEPVLWWSQWGLRPVPEDTGPWHAAVTLESTAGRRLWFGFPASHAAPGSGVELDRLRSLALLWVAGDDVVAVAPWPDGHAFAWIVAMDVQGRDEEIGEALVGASELALRPTVFVYADADGAGARPKALLAEAAEIGSRGDRRTLFQGGNRIHQRKKLIESRTRLEAIHHDEVRGLRVPEERFDELTLHEAAGAGYRYVLGDPGFDRSYPRWVSAEGRPIALVSRGGAADDLGREVDGGARTFARDVELARGLGGLYVMALSSKRVAHPAGRAELAPWTQRIRAAGPWQATAGEVVRWVAARADVLLEAEGTGVVTEGNRGTGVVTVSNRGTGPGEGLMLELYGSSGRPETLALPRLPAGEALRVSLPSEALAMAPPTRRDLRTAGR